MESKGKIYWVEDDSSYIGIHPLKDTITSHSVSRIEHAIIQEHMIRLTTEPTEFGDRIIAYNINLLPDDMGDKFKGNYTTAEGPDEHGYVECRLFENSSVYFLHGVWHEENDEDKIVFTWFAEVRK